jgi:uncharacterized protein (UPF0248 family)
MENLYREWSLEQDQTLWKHRQKSMEDLAVLLGRGVRGVQARLAKLQNVDSAVYQRLFANHKHSYLDMDEDNGNDSEDSETTELPVSKPKLTPCSDILRRIEYDANLQPSDFSILHYDRVMDDLVETRLDAPNTSLAGPALCFVDALPEHRIMAIKYRERIVWDREQRLNLFFNKAEGGIERVISTYDEWKEHQEREAEYRRERQDELAHYLQRILGVEGFDSLKELSNELLDTFQDPTMSIKKQVESYLKDCLAIFRQARETIDLEAIPPNVQEFLEVLSELVALLPQPQLQTLLQAEIVSTLEKLEGKRVAKPTKSAKSSKVIIRTLPELNESDLQESFVRGSGPGGQKINKTSNRVVLIHIPTNINVECQETRSLPQNRKLARQRLRVKLDEYYHGSESRSQQAAERAAVKKQKAQAKSRARHRKKQAEKSSDVLPLDPSHDL